MSTRNGPAEFDRREKGELLDSLSGRQEAPSDDAEPEVATFESLLDALLEPDDQPAPRRRDSRGGRRRDSRGGRRRDSRGKSGRRS